MMNLTTQSLVVVVAESAIEQGLLRGIESLGVSGFTITQARGKGTRGLRASEWDADVNIRVEIVCDSTTASAILHYVNEQYAADYAVFVYTHEVRVSGA